MNTYTNEQQKATENRTVIILRSGRYTDEEGETHTGYGFAVFADPDKPAIFTADDLSTEREAVEALIRTIRDADVAPVHYADVVDDFLS